MYDSLTEYLNVITQRDRYNCLLREQDSADPDSVQQAVSSQGLLDHYKPAAETSAMPPSQTR